MKGIFHTGITVSNLDRALEFYRDVLGLEIMVGPTDTIEGDDVSRGIRVPDAKFRLAVLKAGNSTVELLEYFNPPSSVEKPLPVNNLGAMHVAFQVEHAEAKMKELEAKGIEFFTPLNVVEDGPLKGWKWVYFQDPDGITLEMIEYNGSA